MRRGGGETVNAADLKFVKDVQRWVPNRTQSQAHPGLPSEFDGSPIC